MEDWQNFVNPCVSLALPVRFMTFRLFYLANCNANLEYLYFQQFLFIFAAMNFINIHLRKLFQSSSKFISQRGDFVTSNAVR